jgi:multiple sugar transport system substrate-binding protein
MAVARILILVALVPLLSGCVKQAQQGPAAGRVELVYWPAPNPQEIQLADTLVRRWNRLHPEILVRMQPIPVSQSTEEVLLAAIAGGTTPDVCSNIQPGALYDYIRASGLIALNRFPGFDTLARARADSGLLESFRSGDGQFYQIPWKSNPVMMYYNRRLLREAGISRIPRTYGEYLAAGRKATRDLDGDGQTDVWMGERDIRPIWWQRLFDLFPFYIAASGGKTLFSGGAFAPDRRAASEVFAFFQACYKQRIFPRTFFQGGDPFLLEKKVTHFSGPWEVAAIRKFAPSMDYGVVPLPVPDEASGPVYTHGDFKNISIFSTTRHPDAAWKFVEFLLRPEHDRLLLEICDQIPVRKDLLTNPLFAEYFQNNPVMAGFAGQAARGRGIDAAPDLKEIFDTLSQVYEECAVYGRISPDEAVREMIKRTNIIVEWNR